MSYDSSSSEGEDDVDFGYVAYRRRQEEKKRGTETCATTVEEREKELTSDSLLDMKYNELCRKVWHEKTPINESKQGIDEVDGPLSAEQPETQGMWDYLAPTQVQDTLKGVQEATHSVTETSGTIKTQLAVIADHIRELGKTLTDGISKTAIEGLAHLILGLSVAVVTKQMTPVIQSFLHYGISLGFSTHCMAKLMAKVLRGTPYVVDIAKLGNGNRSDSETESESDDDIETQGLMTS